MINSRHIFVEITAGFLFLAAIILSAVGLWFGLETYPMQTITLIVGYALLRGIQTHLTHPSMNARSKWFMFWFDNEWYKLVLLFTGFWLTTKYI